LRKSDLKQLNQLDVLFVCTDHDRGFFYNEKHFAQLIDTINEDLIQNNIKTGTISRLPSKYKPENKYGNIYSINNLLKYNYILNKYSKFVYGDISRTSIQPVELGIDMWLRVIDRTKPKYIISIEPTIELCIASKLRNIEIAELQHGVLSSVNYYSENFRAKYGQMGWPTLLLCWDIDSENWAKKNIGKYVKTKVIGNPWVNRFIRQDVNDNLVIDEITNLPDLKKDKKNILVSLQYDLTDKYVNEVGIPYQLLDFIKKDGNEYNWLLRIHPVEIKKTGYKNLDQKLKNIFSNASNIEWDKSSRSALPALLLNTDLHITWNSAVTIEASWFGIRTALLSNDTSNIEKYFSAQLENGYASIIQNKSSAIGSWISQYISKPKVKNYRSSYYDSYKVYLNELIHKLS